MSLVLRMESLDREVPLILKHATFGTSLTPISGDLEIVR